MRKIQKNIEEGNRILHRHEGLQLRVGEMQELIRISQETGKEDFIYMLMNNAYSVGIATGRRNCPHKNS